MTTSAGHRAAAEPGDRRLTSAGHRAEDRLPDAGRLPGEPEGVSPTAPAGPGPTLRRLVPDGAP
jgi:hypothetical protein